jgi:hypothetical protein
VRSLPFQKKVEQDCWQWKRPEVKCSEGK